MTDTWRRCSWNAKQALGDRESEAGTDDIMSFRTQGVRRTLPEELTAAEAQRRRKDRARQRAGRQAEQAQWRAAQTYQSARRGAGPRVRDTYRRAWAIHVRYFGSVAQHCVSLARMAADLSGVEVAQEVHIGKMYRAHDYLIQHGHLLRLERRTRRNDGKQHTNLWQVASAASTGAVRVSREDMAYQDMDAHRVSQEDAEYQDAEDARRDTRRS